MASSTLLTAKELGAWRGFLEVHTSLIHQLDTELVAEHGLPLTSYEVLMYVGDAGGRLRMGELADRVLLSRSGITRLVDRLERQGLVEREPCDDDKRGLFAVLTRAGREKLAAARPTHLAGVRKLFLSRLDDEEAQSLSRIWERLLVQGDG
jgi:DNA-binding MarR family transcriptional regulator